MSDVSAPASTPVAPVSGGGDLSGAEGTPQGGPQQSESPARARNNAGQFLAKEGAAGVVPAEAPAGATEAQKEAYRFKRSLKVFGKEETVDLDEDGITRELQIKRALEKKVGDYAKGHQQAQKILELAKSNPEAFLRELGHDPEAVYRKNLARQAALGAMSPEEREFLELKEFKQQAEAKEQQRLEQEKKAKHEASTQKLVEENNQRFMKALQGSGLPQTYESLFHIAETARIALDDGIEYTDAELVQETSRRLDTLTDRYLGSLEGEALAKKLGPKRVQSLIAAEVRRFEASQNFTAPPPVEEAPARDEGDGFLSSSDVNERLRRMRNGL